MFASKREYFRLQVETLYKAAAGDYFSLDLSCCPENKSKMLFDRKSRQSCGENRPASPRASHYKAKNPEKILSKLNLFWIFHFALLHFSRYFVVRSAWLRQSAHGLSSYKKEKIQQFVSKLPLLYFPFLTLLNIFVSTPSWNRTSNSPLGGRRWGYYAISQHSLKCCQIPDFSVFRDVLSLGMSYAF